MSQAPENGQALLINRIILLKLPVEQSQYLRHILEFVDCEVSEIDSVEQAEKSIQANSDDFVSVFAADAAVVRKFGHSLTQQPAVFIIGDEAFSSSDGQDILGSIQLPTHYDALMNLLHKAQIFIESQRDGEGPRRPLELFRSLSGNSRGTRAVNKMIEQVARTEATVLVLGESGTGKEVVARKLHYHSKRKGKPFVPVNCGAIPGDLLESELFGHEKGAFTGAISARQGRFELAEGGTLFLDEIGDMSMPMQVKLLRVLQERTFERVGSNKTINCDVRIIAATHRNLEQAIEEGNFREDLFYRLNVFPIEMPPLRERADDVPVLVKDLIRRIEHEKRGSVRLTPAAIGTLQNYRWPGNVRELANLIERLAILFPFGLVDVKDLPEKFRAGVPVPEEPIDDIEPDLELDSSLTSSRLPSQGIDLKTHLSDLEQNFIRQALEEADGVVAHAANRLKMRRTTLVEKLRKYGISAERDLSET